MESELERARFEATNALIEREFGRVGSVLELGCGEGHQTGFLARLSDQQYGIDVSSQAIERARRRVPAAQFAATDIFGQPWGGHARRFDLVTACEVLYYLGDPAATLKRMRHLGRCGLVTFFAPAARRVGAHVEAIPGTLSTCAPTRRAAGAKNVTSPQRPRWRMRFRVAAGSPR